MSEVRKKIFFERGEAESRSILIGSLVLDSLMKKYGSLEQDNSLA